MSKEDEKYAALTSRLDSLLERQFDLIAEINQVKAEVTALKADKQGQLSPEASAEAAPVNRLLHTAEPAQVTETPPIIPKQETVPPVAQRKPGPAPRKPAAPAMKRDLESWIGQNLISKIGIAITVIGVAVGVKYSIDHNLVSPLVRIITGYAMGVALQGIGYRLRKKYHGYSAILVGGGIAAMYLVTFSAYTFFGLFPQTVAFGIMVLLTIYAVYTALSYNLQVLAHIALVGAYAVPLLLSDGSGKVGVLFTYIVIINLGILAVAYYKAWVWLKYSALVITWLLFFVWYSDGYQAEEHFTLSLVFLSLTFLTFYAMFMVNKLREQKPFREEDLILLLGNSLLYYMVVFDMMQTYEVAEPYLGLFTVANGVVHLVAALLIYWRGADVRLFYYAAGLGAAFLTVTIPIELDGDVVTLLWSVEGAILYVIGRRKQSGFYQVMAGFLLIIAFFSLFEDWNAGYGQFTFYSQEYELKPLINIHFLTSVIYALSAGTVAYFTIKDKDLPIDKDAFRPVARVIGTVVGIAFIITLYNMFRLEIANAINQAYVHSRILAEGAAGGVERYVNDPWEEGFIIQFVYTVCFVCLLAYLNLRRIKNNILGGFILVFQYLLTFTYLTAILFMLSELRDMMQIRNPDEWIYVMPRSFPLFMRYVVMVSIGASLYLAYRQIRAKMDNEAGLRIFSIGLYITILWTLSSELIHWLDMAGYQDTYKLALSILWGCFAVFMVVKGILQDQKYLRVCAIVLFGLTLIKLFAYDISHMNTLSKTIVMVVLGILLLVTSFLYNRFKASPKPEEEMNE